MRDIKRPLLLLTWLSIAVLTAITPSPDKIVITTPTTKSCSTINGIEVCTSCNPNQLLVDTKCVRIPTLPQTNCDVISINQNCVTCSTGYENYHGHCVLIRRKLCLEESDSSTCTKCIPNFTPVDGKCVAIKLTPDNCDVCSDSNPKECLTCKEGYEIDSTGKQCILSMEFCIRRDPTMKKCIACDLGYTQKIANVCSRYMITLAVAKRCTPNEIPAHEKCIPKTPGCVAYDQFAVCYKCDRYSDLLSNFNCMLQNCVLLDTTRYRCSQCQDNYVIDAVTGRCGVRLDAKAALISPIIDKDVNCLLSNPDNTCKQCANNYARFNGKCFKEDVMCKIRSELGGCESCYERSYLGKDGICMLIRSNCDIYDPKTGECIDCVPGWTKNALNECQRN